MTSVSKSDHQNQGTSYNEDWVNIHSRLLLCYWIPIAHRMKPKLVANTSRPDEIWPLWTCPAFPEPPQQDLVHHIPDTQVCPQFLQQRAVLSSSAISDSWSLNRRRKKEQREESKESPHSSLLGWLLLVLQAWFKCLLLRKAFGYPHPR